MLSYKYRMPTKRRLLAVVSRYGGSQSLGNEPACVLDNRLLAIKGVIRKLFRAESELATESRPRQREEQFIDVAHERL